jgi:hypothetical protein
MQIMAREKCGLLAGPCTKLSADKDYQCLSFSVMSGRLTLAVVNGLECAVSNVTSESASL